MHRTRGTSSKPRAAATGGAGVGVGVRRAAALALVLACHCHVLAAASLTAGWEGFAAAQPNTTAVAAAGTFVGYVANGTRTWRGIPYAQPPVGNLRWRKTAPAAPLTAPLETKAFRADCAQIGPGWASLGGMVSDCHNQIMGCPNMTWTNATSEDCLYLNVYSPDLTLARKVGGAGGFPVVVYFPSGAFQWGAANDLESNAYAKASTPGWRDAVLVTANYRTGIFGFLASEGLSKRSGDNSSGLFGIQDQTAALEWVQRNIQAFGGDPDRVMVFGESAGATSASIHLVMNDSVGLFQAVAIDSGAFNQWTYRPWADAMDIWRNVTAALGCTDWADPVACMLTKDKDALLNVSDTYYGNATLHPLPHPESPNGTQWGPVVEGVLLTAPPVDLLRQGRLPPAYSKVHVLLGSNLNEGTTFRSATVRTRAQFSGWCNHTFGAEVGAKVFERYSRPDMFTPQPTPTAPFAGQAVWGNAANQVIGDFVVRCPTRAAAAALTTQGHDVFMYDFVHQPWRSVNWASTRHLGAFHGAEVPFVFNDGFELSGGERNLSQAMAQYWVNMASSGDPNTWEGPRLQPRAHTGPHTDARRQKQRQSVLPVPRPSANKYWWKFAGGVGCDMGGAGGCSGVVSECKAACLKDPDCGGFRGKSFEPGDCGDKLAAHSGASTLFALRSKPQPPPPPPRLPGTCQSFTQSTHCYNLSSAYRVLAVNVSRKDYTSLGACCAACQADSPKCKHWIVPTASNGTQCVLLAAPAPRPLPPHTLKCVGASAPQWLPPATCHARFVIMHAAMRVNTSAEISKHRPATVVRRRENSSLADCCAACYQDYASDNPCRAWAMPEPVNGTCVLYGTWSGIRLYKASNTSSNCTHSAFNCSDTFRGATRLGTAWPPPPPPPQPCPPPPPSAAALPVWPKFTQAGAALAEEGGAGRVMQLDVCNITAEREMRGASDALCVLWAVWMPPQSEARHRVERRMREQGYGTPPPGGMLRGGLPRAARPPHPPPHPGR